MYCKKTQIEEIYLETLMQDRKNGSSEICFAKYASVWLFGWNKFRYSNWILYQLNFISNQIMCTSTLQVPSTQKKMHEKFNFSPRSSSFFFFKVMDTLNWVKILLKLHLQVLQLNYLCFQEIWFNYEKLENETIK